MEPAVSEFASVPVVAAGAGAKETVRRAYDEEASGISGVFPLS
ncbi:MAG TPA: hypothetical protein PK849_13455 [Synergistales bacterium]|nr:hypothetical protein [Synergistales bacterium]